MFEGLGAGEYRCFPAHSSAVSGGAGGENEKTLKTYARLSVRLSVCVYASSYDGSKDRCQNKSIHFDRVKKMKGEKKRLPVFFVFEDLDDRKRRRRRKLLTSAW